ncbi:unnamed protein product [Arabidopsis halleri]
MVQLGSNLEEQWMRSLNLAITNWIIEIKAFQHLKSPSPLFSYAFSTQGLWKVHMYCPVVSMEMESVNSSLNDERLFFSLNYHQLEGVIQLNHRIYVREKWFNVAVNIDNVRCDIIRLVNEKLLSERGMGTEEKHFPLKNIIATNTNESIKHLNGIRTKIFRKPIDRIRSRERHRSNNRSTKHILWTQSLS